MKEIDKTCAIRDMNDAALRDRESAKQEQSPQHKRETAAVTMARKIEYISVEMQVMISIKGAFELNAMASRISCTETIVGI